jgi:hypothetical protein
LKLKYDELVTNVAFNFNSSRYMAVLGGWDINLAIQPRTAPWRFVPIYVYWAAFNSQASADAARPIDIVNLAGGY